MTGRHRAGRSFRWRLVVAVLAASVGRGHVGRHRLADSALGRSPDAVRQPTAAPADQLTAAPVQLSVVPALSATVETLGAPAAATARDALADTMPHPVVALFPIVDPVPAPALVPRGSRSAEDRVFDAVDGERAERTIAELAAGAERREQRGQHAG